MGTPMQLPLDCLDGRGLQTRAAMSEETIEEYAEVYRKYGIDTLHGMPGVSAVYNAATDRFWLTDGFHRVEAARRAGLKKIVAICRNGTFTDALKEALGANAKNGLRRTNADKRNALEMAWAARVELFGGEPSNGVLAETCGVSERTVNRFRSEVSTCDNVAGGDEPAARIGRDGRTTHVPAAADALPIHVDKVGQPIPENLHEVFSDRTCTQAIRALMRGFKVVDVARKTHKYGFLLSQDNVESVRTAIAMMRRNLPYAVCGACGGSGCLRCRNHGYLSHFDYSRILPEHRPGGEENWFVLHNVGLSTADGAPDDAECTVTDAEDDTEMMF